VTGRGLFFAWVKNLINKFLVQLTVVECGLGFKRVNLCVKESLYRALVIFEASHGLRRYQVVNEALELYITYYDLIKKLGPEGVKKALEGRT
jgi:hypothetical protein